MLQKNIYAFIVVAGFFLIGCNSITTNDAVVAPKKSIGSVNPYISIDQSPMDVSYYPINYPTLKMNGGSDVTGLLIRLIYSRPQKKGRSVFGTPKSIQQYGSYWRLGANEASEIEFFKPAIIKGQEIGKGRYIIYCIPFEDKWVIVLNSNLFSWGLHPDVSKDIAKIEIPVQKTDENIEYFTMVFKQSPTGVDLIMAWDNAKAVLPISF
jgi:Protein of unknown function (DUF2911)